jgi:hypothetical protein
MLAMKILLLWLVIVKGSEEEDSGKLKDDTEGGVYAQAVAPNTTDAEGAVLAADLLQACSRGFHTVRAAPTVRTYPPFIFMLLPTPANHITNRTT